MCINLNEASMFDFLPLAQQRVVVKKVPDANCVRRAPRSTNVCGHDATAGVSAFGTGMGCRISFPRVCQTAHAS